MSLPPDRQWKLTQSALESLLARLNPDREAAAEEYERLRRKLVDYFDARGSPSADAHADETLDRIARKLEQGEVIERIANYSYGVAKWVLLESQTHLARKQRALEDLPSMQEGLLQADHETRISCMERCLSKLPEPNRELIIAYYQESVVTSLARREALAQTAGLKYGTLKTRVHRTRALLAACLNECLQAGGGNE